jgi:hypothetical protein
MSWEDAASSAFGVGFVFTENDPFFCVDVDGAFNMASGQWSPLACEVMVTFPDALWEVSHSGTGLHVIARGAQALPPSHQTRRKGLPLEVYSRKRFIALTGFNMRGDAGHDYGPALVGFMQRQALPLERPEVVFEEGRDPAWSGPEDDDELLAYALAQRPSTAAKAFGVQATFKHIWEMDEKVLATAYTQPGRADGLAFNYSDVEAALAAHLSYFTGRDLPRMRRLFERWPGYRREKMEARGGDLLRRALTCGLQNPRVLNRPPPPQAAHLTPPPPGGARPLCSNLFNLLNGQVIADTDYPELPWLVEDLVPEGCHLLVGKPKKGKSWMSLQLAIATATGTEFMGHQCKQGRVMYLALEDTPRRIKKRLRQCCEALGVDYRRAGGQILFGTTADNIPTADAGLYDMIAQALDADPTITLVIVDTLHKARPQPARNEGVYAYDRRCVDPLTDILNSRPGRSMLIVHHAAKNAREDPHDMASGSLGLTGACDGGLFLASGLDGQTILHVNCRDGEGALELSVKLSNAHWDYLGDPETVGMSDSRAKLIHTIGKYAMGASPKTIAEDSGIDANTVKQHLMRMSKAGLVIKDGRATYKLTPKAEQIGLVPAPL